jgi:transcriptional regulator with XRE-family HTH domain
VESLSSLLRAAMDATGSTQVALSALTGVAQGRISEYVCAKRAMSPGTAKLLFDAMGLRLNLEATIHPVEMNSSDRRSWLLHRKACAKLTSSSLPHWRDLIAKNAEAMRRQIQGGPHLENLAKWERLAQTGDIKGLRGAMLDPGEAGRAMRDVSPLAGVLTQQERCEALGVDYLEAL